MGGGAGGRPAMAAAVAAADLGHAAGTGEEGEAAVGRGGKEERGGGAGGRPAMAAAAGGGEERKPRLIPC